jgi:hypothetical protein
VPVPVARRSVSLLRRSALLRRSVSLLRRSVAVAGRAISVPFGSDGRRTLGLADRTIAPFPAPGRVAGISPRSILSRSILSGSVLSRPVAARAIVSGTVFSRTLIGSAGAAAAIGAFLVDVAVGLDVADFEEVRRDRAREEQRLPVVEVDPLLPRVDRVHLDHRVVARGPPPGLERVLRRQREVEEAPPTRTQPVPSGAVRVVFRYADVEDVRRLRGLARLHLDRVPVERADRALTDLVPRPVAAFDGLDDVVGLDRLAEALVQGGDDVLEIGEAELVHLEVELLGLVAEHVSERAGDAFDQGGVEHGRGRCGGRPGRIAPGNAAAHSDKVPALKQPCPEPLACLNASTSFPCSRPCSSAA